MPFFGTNVDAYVRAVKYAHREGVAHHARRISARIDSVEKTLIERGVNPDTAFVQAALAASVGARDGAKASARLDQKYTRVIYDPIRKAFDPVKWGDQKTRGDLPRAKQRARQAGKRAAASGRVASLTHKPAGPGPLSGSRLEIFHDLDELYHNWKNTRGKTRKLARDAYRAACHHMGVKPRA